MAQSRFRVQAPNSVARDMLVVALNTGAGDLGALFRDQDWPGVTFVGFAEQGGDFRDGSWRDAAAASPVDVVMMIAVASQSLDMAREIGTFALDRAIKVSAILLIRGADADQVSQSLRQLRPWTRALTILNDESCLADFLHVLGG